MSKIQLLNKKIFMCSDETLKRVYSIEIKDELNSDIKKIDIDFYLEWLLKNDSITNGIKYHLFHKKYLCFSCEKELNNKKECIGGCLPAIEKHFLEGY